MADDNKGATDAKGSEGAEAKAAEAKAEAGKEGEGAGEGKTAAQIAAEAGAKTGEKESKTVPEAAFLEEKKARKAAEKKLADLKESIEKGASQESISSDIDAISEQFNVDKDFLKKFAKTVREETKKELEETLTAKERASQKEKEIEDAFQKEFKRVMERMPEYEGVVNAGVIKQLSLLASNANKTFAQIIEETYGNSLTGKRTIDKTKPAGGKDPEPLDFAKARKDGAYFAEVMANPALKKEYNERMLKEGL